ncbi:hypothetical protein F3N42_01190 [Marinihelvus fidelis]|uniref:Uncharacterized protein n=1 Tax=Marinihelvus fidelis TaxID=2613842 RepID=A0A5N0TI75_9GAMM|nr:hypothetical protein [Marinihelvus fidelis]KAA9134188.1 hypothetical protein F3N42_01190 [Marinihelvus fidelis]
MKTSLKIFGLCVIVAHGTGCSYHGASTDTSATTHADTTCESSADKRDYRNPFLRSRRVGG